MSLGSEFIDGPFVNLLTCIYYITEQLVCNIELTIWLKNIYMIVFQF